MTDKERKEKRILDKAECIQELHQLDKMYVGQEICLQLSGVNCKPSLRVVDGIGSITHDLGHPIFHKALTNALWEYKKKLQEFIDKE